MGLGQTKLGFKGQINLGLRARQS